jgi:hypothetical protein
VDLHDRRVGVPRLIVTGIVVVRVGVEGWDDDAVSVRIPASPADMLDAGAKCREDEQNQQITNNKACASQLTSGEPLRGRPSSGRWRSSSAASSAWAKALTAYPAALGDARSASAFPFWSKGASIHAGTGIVDLARAQ